MYVKHFEVRMTHNFKNFFLIHMVYFCLVKYPKYLLKEIKDLFLLLKNPHSEAFLELSGRNTVPRKLVLNFFNVAIL